MRRGSGIEEEEVWIGWRRGGLDGMEKGEFDGMGWDWMEMGLEVEGWKGGRKGVRPLDRWMDG